MKKNFTIALDEDLKKKVDNYQVRSIIRGPEMSKGAIILAAIRRGLPLLAEEMGWLKISSSQIEEVFTTNAIEEAK